MTPKLFHTITELRHYLGGVRQTDQKIGFVPTMGALHIGHRSLVEFAKQHCDNVGVSIFVNPTQFLPGEDFNKYPRTLDADLHTLSDVPCDWVFAPAVEEIYPKGASSSIDPGPVGTILEGAFRPGHFQGVATVVVRLFGIVQPDVAVFGQKDAQQCFVIKHIVQDFAIPTVIEIAPTIRETDGLACSSRNRYLSPDERSRALGLYVSLNAGLRSLLGGDPVAAAERKMYETISAYSPDRIDYLTFVDDETFGTPTPPRAIRAVGAVRFGTTRLIDNVSTAELKH